MGMMKILRFILIQIISVFAITAPCFGQSKGEIVAKNGIYAEIELNPKRHGPITMTMFFSSEDTIHIPMDNIENTIKSVMRNGDFVSVGMSDISQAVIDIFDCTQQQGDGAFIMLKEDLDWAYKMKEFMKKKIKGHSGKLQIRYTQMQAFFLKTSYEKFGGDHVSSNGIPLEYIPNEYLILLSIINTDRPDEINIEVLN